MERATTVEVTFLRTRREGTCEPATAEGVVRLPDATLRPFSGWLDLLSALEAAVSCGDRS